MCIYYGFKFFVNIYDMIVDLYITFELITCQSVEKISVFFLLDFFLLALRFESLSIVFSMQFGLSALQNINERA